MSSEDDTRSLAEVVDKITTAGADDRDISVEDILVAVGRRSFGPLLLAPGLILVSPAAGVPGVPTAGAVLIVLIAGQLLIGRRHFWLPQFLLRRSISHERMAKAGKFLMPIARFVDRLVRPRMPWLTRRPAQYVIAVNCLLVSAMMPPLEAIPFANTVTAAAIAAFGLALVARDGVLALLAFGLTGAGAYLLIGNLPF